MQIFFISDKQIVILAFILWFMFQVLAARISHQVPDHLLSTDNFLFKSRKWERDGEIYSQIFKVKKWKKFLPDGAAINKNDYRKKNITDFSEENLHFFLRESCRAELNHLIAITPFWFFGLFAPLKVVGYMLIYALFINVPCIIVQRFNRPRIIRIVEKKSNRYNNPHIKALNRIKYKF